MARAKGREIVVELMDAVEKLQATSAEHSAVLTDMARDAISTSAHLTALASQTAHTARRTNELSQRMDELSGRMNDLSGRMNELSGGMAVTSQLVGELSAQMALSAQRLAALESDAHRNSANATRSAELARNTQLGLGELARLLRDLAEDTGTRFETIEARLVKLERKVG